MDRGFEKRKVTSSNERNFWKISENFQEEKFLKIEIPVWIELCTHTVDVEIFFLQRDVEKTLNYFNGY